MAFEEVVQFSSDAVWRRWLGISILQQSVIASTFGPGDMLVDVKYGQELGLQDHYQVEFEIKNVQTHDRPVEVIRIDGNGHVVDTGESS